MIVSPIYIFAKIACGKGHQVYALVVMKISSTWHAAKQSTLSMDGHMAKQGGRWSAIGLKWPAVIFNSEAHPDHT